jgi:exodeoxyribonuclease VII large subunit
MHQPSLFEFSPHVFTVKAINAYIRQKLEADLNLQDVWLEGEISNWKQAASGHIYFTLKDADASIRSVIWRTQANRLIYRPQRDGEAVLAHGRISVYEAAGTYQFYVDDLEPAGQGVLHAEFDRLKTKLSAEGLFDPDLKRDLPLFPRRIGVVTSPDAAALRDILNVLRRRYPVAQVILSPTPVQGDTAPPQICVALAAVSEQPVDVIILARGGGSLEDLWAFNDETVARAISACPVPLVTGIGHEIDFTIADFVADVRAPTPSAAAELVSPDILEFKQRLVAIELELSELVRRVGGEARAKLQQQQWSLDRLSPQTAVDNNRQRVDALVSDAGRTLSHRLVLERQGAEALSSQLEALNPTATLARGYAIVRQGQNIVTNIDQVGPGDELTIQVVDGEIGATVDTTQD